MSNIVLISDSSCDLPEALATQYNVEIIPYYVSFNQETYYREITELPLAELLVPILKLQLAFDSITPPQVLLYICYRLMGTYKEFYLKMLWR